jgi:hypothetical protein
MRAPSQLKLESAPAYVVRMRLRIAPDDYLPGTIVDGDVARAWPTFRSLLGMAWLIPATAVAPDQSPVTVAATRTTKKRSG